MTNYEQLAEKVRETWDMGVYKAAIIAYLTSGDATEDDWMDVAEHLAAASENIAPLQLDVSLGLAAPCPECAGIVWLEDQCEHCEPQEPVI